MNDESDNSNPSDNNINKSDEDRSFNHEQLELVYEDKSDNFLSKILTFQRQEPKSYYDCPNKHQIDRLRLKQSPCHPSIYGSDNNQSEEKSQQRKQSKVVGHQCSCNLNGQQCQAFFCSCYQTSDEICVPGQCCPQCVKIKNTVLKEKYQLLQKVQLNEGSSKVLDAIRQSPCRNMYYFMKKYPEETWLQNMVFCTCKRSQCSKSYCVCFQKGIKCSQFCNCLDCANRLEQNEQKQKRSAEIVYQKVKQLQVKEVEDKIQQIDEDIDQFFNCPLESNNFSEKMEFQSPNFDKFMTSQPNQN